jgi:hypothetical protein
MNVKAISMGCPACNAVLSIQLDPFDIETNIIDTVLDAVEKPRKAAAGAKKKTKKKKS